MKLGLDLLALSCMISARRNDFEINKSHDPISGEQDIQHQSVLEKRKIGERDRQTKVRNNIQNRTEI